MQSKIASLVETLVNIAIGFAVSMVLNFVLLPQVGCTISAEQNIFIVCVFTITSIIRSYLTRRLFNHITASKLERNGGAE